MLNTPLRHTGPTIFDALGHVIAIAIDTKTASAVVSFVNATASQ